MGLLGALWGWVLVLVLNFAAVPCAHAFKLSPMSMSFDPAGAGSSRAFEVENTNAEKAAIQISLARRLVKPDGTEDQPEAGDEFTVYPTQFVLAPGEKRTVRVSWLGDAKPARELAYRIIAEQLPVELERAKGKKKNEAYINVLLKYVGSIYITPPGAKADVRVTKTEWPARDKLAVTLENQGTGHRLLLEPSLDVIAGTARVRLRPDQLKGLAGENLLAGTTRRFEVPWPGPPLSAAAKVEAKVELGLAP